MNFNGLYIATPCYNGQLTSTYFLSMISLVKNFTYSNITFQTALIYNESVVSRARNTFVKKFLETDFSHFMFIDADIEFNDEDIIKMIMYDEDIIVGAYPKKMIDFNKVRTNSNQDHSRVVVNKTNNKPNKKGLIEVFDAGTGFMLIKREVFEKFIKEYPDSYYIDENDNEKYYLFFDYSLDEEEKRYLSEDYKFCKKFRKLGGKIFLDPNIQLNHSGFFNYKTKY